MSDDPNHRLGANVAGELKFREVNIVVQTAEQIMSERGVARSQAYRIRRQQLAGQFEGRSVSESLKEGILKSLWTGGTASAADMTQRMQRAGYSEAAHGVVHVIWALQKEALVSFRESKKNGLTNIKLTQQGQKRAWDLVQADQRAKVSAQSPVTISVSEKPAPPKVQPEPPVDPQPLPIRDIVENIRLAPALFASKYPLIQKLRTKKDRIEAAAKTLEDEGMIEEAARALELATYSEFEKEVLRLVDDELHL